MNYTYGSAIALIIVTSYYLGIPLWIYDKYTKAKIILRLLENINESDTKTEKNTLFAINDSDMSAEITYNVMNEFRTINIPYSRQYIVPMSQFKAELLHNGNISKDITQQPGIPYMVSALDLGGTDIKITNQETEKAYIYHGNYIPMYAKEVMEFE